jgi:hypothetical protein
MKRPNVERVLASMKDFQRDSVDYVFSRLFDDPDPTDRFLIADEVGLGKTLVARGIIARTIDRLWDEQDRRIDIVYICSNADIARQNVRRLNVLDEDVPVLPRITMLPRYVRDLKNRRVNFVALTPGTSFDLRSTQGEQGERALMYHLLRRHWGFRGSGPLNVFQGWVRSQQSFRGRVHRIDPQREIDEEIQEKFLQALDQHVEQQRAREEHDVRSRFEDLARQLRWRGRRLARATERDVSSVIGELRGVLAAACLEALEPDLVILDEFQRFKGLLHGEDEAARLAQGLFDYAAGTDSPVKVLLLSATPYRMYTLADEPEDDHYRDFLETVRFLFRGDEDRVRVLKELLQRYRSSLLRLSDRGAGDQLLAARSDLEAALRSVIVRTERLAVTETRDGMLREESVHDLSLTVPEVRTYVALEQVARLSPQPDTVDYWKSAPYLLNFMQDYELKRRFKAGLADPEIAPQIGEVLRRANGLVLATEALRDYGAIDPQNARLRWLLAHLVTEEAWRLLWAPPSLPYYQLQEPFTTASRAGFTKRLLFSSWAVVPRALGSLVSYWAEQQLMKSMDADALNTLEFRQARSGLLRFTEEAGRLTGMPVLALLYPSPTLARIGDPWRLGSAISNDGAPPSALAVVAAARSELEGLMAPILEKASRSGAPDEQWYWWAALQLDRRQEPSAARRWLMQPDLGIVWIGADDEPGSRWLEHVARAREGWSARWRPSGPPPSDLLDVLAELAVAGPAVSSLRAVGRVTGGRVTVGAMNASGRIAWGLRSLFNSPEGTAAVRVFDRSDPFWRRALQYCVAGGLQSVLDEYVHVTREAEGLFDKSAEAVFDGLAKAFSASLVRTVTLRVDGLSPVEGGVDRQDLGMRGRFALRFGKERFEDSGESSPEDHVRRAFNSPFWPFVLATTSVGQEGLDFHQYCHAVIHWNLPSNPVDLEQREGRVHRYKGHAVRKNLAQAFGAPSPGANGPDPWEALFSRAVHERAPGGNDLIPYWVFTIDGGSKIERYVLALPLSRDEARAAAVKQSLVLYRMVFGQPRQEDLIAYLLRSLPMEVIKAHIEQARIDLAPPMSPRPPTYQSAPHKREALEK